jgi:hypothetical protein
MGAPASSVFREGREQGDFLSEREFGDLHPPP